MDYAWSWRCVDLCCCCCCMGERQAVEQEHQRRIAALCARLLLVVDHAGESEQAKNERCSMANRALVALQNLPTGPVTSEMLRPVVDLPALFNPVALGWRPPPTCCRRHCHCLVRCCNRDDDQQPLFLVQQMAADGRPYGCCHARQDPRDDSTCDWVDEVEKEEKEHGVIPGAAGTLVGSGSSSDAQDPHANAAMPAPVPPASPHGSKSSTVQVGCALRQPHEEEVHCQLCDCFDCGPLDPFRCVCSVVSPGMRGTVDLHDDQAASRAAELTLALQGLTETRELSALGGAGSASSSGEEDLGLPAGSQLDQEPTDDASVQLDGIQLGLIAEGSKQSMRGNGIDEEQPSSAALHMSPAQDARLSAMIPGFDGMPEAEKLEYRQAFSIVRRGTRRARR